MDIFCQPETELIGLNKILLLIGDSDIFVAIFFAGGTVSVIFFALDNILDSKGY
jgi:hypothetical protein